MKKLVLYVLTVVSTIILNGYLTNAHRDAYYDAYSECSKDAPSDDFDRVEECTHDDLKVKILGTILFSDGSIIGDYYGLGNG